MTERSPRGPRRPGGEHDERDFPGGLFAVACPACGKSLAARARDAGRGAKCPCCDAGLLLPAAPHAAATEVGPAEARPAEQRIPTVPAVSTVPPADAPPAQQPASAAAHETARPVVVEPPAAPAPADGMPWPAVDAALPTFEIPPDPFGGTAHVAVAAADAVRAVGDGAEQEQAAVRDRRARERRRARRSLFMLVVGSAILLGIVFAFTGFGGRR
jgi:hypothetical protein